MEDKKQEIYEVFKDYYGEENVDFQKQDEDLYNIIVYLPKVTVTNENDESIDITDLYVRTSINDEGLMIGSFGMTRGSYIKSQVLYDYCHSHAKTIPLGREFSKCCLGSGPIVHTISQLQYECDLDRWALYCYELDKYTQVESISGVPYHYLNRVSTSGYEEEEYHSDYDKLINSSIGEDPRVLTEDPSIINTIRGFVFYLVKENKLNFIPCGSHYFIGHSFNEYISIITTAFVDFIKENGEDIQYYISKNILRGCSYDKGKFFTRAVISMPYVDIEGREACVFKGKTIKVKVIDDIDQINDYPSVVFDFNMANYILYKILNVINYGFTEKCRNDSSEWIVL